MSKSKNQRLRKNMTCIDVVFRGKPMNPRVYLCMFPFMIIGTVLSGMVIHNMHSHNKLVVGLLVSLIVLVDLLYAYHAFYALFDFHYFDRLEAWQKTMTKVEQDKSITKVEKNISNVEVSLSAFSRQITRLERRIDILENAPPPAYSAYGSFEGYVRA